MTATLGARGALVLATLLGSLGFAPAAGAVLHAIGDQELTDSVGAPGDDVDVGAGSFSIAPGAARSLETTTPVRVGETVTLTLNGVEGDLFGFVASTGTGSLSFPGVVGPLLPAAPLILADGGAIPASGELELSFVPGSVGAADFQTFYLQPIFVSQAAVPYLGAPSALVILGPGF